MSEHPVHIDLLLMHILQLIPASVATVPANLVTSESPFTDAETFPFRSSFVTVTVAPAFFTAFTAASRFPSETPAFFNAVLSSLSLNVAALVMLTSVTFAVAVSPATCCASVAASVAAA